MRKKSRNFGRFLEKRLSGCRVFVTCSLAWAFFSWGYQGCCGGSSRAGWPLEGSAGSRAGAHVLRRPAAPAIPAVLGGARAGRGGGERWGLFASVAPGLCWIPVLRGLCGVGCGWLWRLWGACGGLGLRGMGRRWASRLAGGSAWLFGVISYMDILQYPETGGACEDVWLNIFAKMDSFWSSGFLMG